MKIMPIEQCGAVRKCMASPQSYKSQMRSGQVGSTLFFTSNKNISPEIMQGDPL